MKVIKRDGRVEEFNKEKIFTAITKAIKKEESIDQSIINSIGIEIENELKQKENIEIEEIQDMVENKLMKFNLYITAKSYIKYREERRIQRESRCGIYKKLDGILKCDNVSNSNANVDEYSFGGRKFESAGTILKKYALDNIVRPEIAKAHIENRIYLHDLDSYAVGMHNCLNVNVKKLITDGFSTRNGDVRGASGISTAMQQLAVIFQVQSQHGFAI